jgi:hypothetical protein
MEVPMVLKVEKYLIKYVYFQPILDDVHIKITNRCIKKIYLKCILNKLFSMSLL